MVKIPKIGILLVNSIEDMEFIIPFDIWRRARFIVETISCEIKNGVILYYTNLKINTSCKLKLTNLDQYDLLFFPGGPGFRAYLYPPSTEKEFLESKLHSSIKKFYKDEGKWLVSICAAPVALLSILEKEFDKTSKFTCYNNPKIIGDYSQLWIDKPIVLDLKNKFITAQSASCAFDLAFLVVEIFAGKKGVDELSSTLFYRYNSILNG